MAPSFGSGFASAGFADAAGVVDGAAEASLSSVGGIELLLLAAAEAGGDNDGAEADGPEAAAAAGGATTVVGAAEGAVVEDVRGFSGANGVNIFLGPGEVSGASGARAEGFDTVAGAMLLPSGVNGASFEAGVADDEGPAVRTGEEDGAAAAGGVAEEEAAAGATAGLSSAAAGCATSASSFLSLCFAGVTATSVCTVLATTPLETAAGGTAADGATTTAVALLAGFAAATAGTSSPIRSSSRSGKAKSSSSAMPCTGFDPLRRSEQANGDLPPPPAEEGRREEDGARAQRLVE
jgi:hypothetical protein